jgi:glutathione S-transferase
MIELIQCPWSPFCIVQRRILEFAGVPFKIIDIPSNDRALIWRLTGGRYYGVPILTDEGEAVFEKDHDSQVLAKYLDGKFRLGLFPPELEGVQTILSRCIENEVEEMTFKLNDIYWQENVPPAEQLGFLRHKERKFGGGCLEQWRHNQKGLLAELARRLTPFEQMLAHHPFLLGAEPRFVDFDLFGMLGNFLYSGHYRLPPAHRRLKAWLARLDKLKFAPSSEKLRS